MTWDGQKWQGYSEYGEPTGLVKSEECAKGALHGSAHVWLWRCTDGFTEVLVQHRSAEKPTWPNYWDISAAGHIDIGETPLQAALRESEEEIGITIKKSDLRLWFVHRQYMVWDSPKIIENEFQFVYGTEYIQKNDLRFQLDEVDDAKWVGLSEFRRMITSGEIVPQGNSYFTELISKLENV